MNHFIKAADALDAAVFNGDGLLDAKNREDFKWFIERWQTKLAQWEDIAADIAVDRRHDLIPAEGGPGDRNGKT